MANSSNWGVKETYKLLELWSKQPVQANLLSMKRNIDVYNQIASEMMAAGFQRTGLQCQSKIKKMKVVYRKIKSRMESSEPVGKTWQYFDIFDKVLGGNAEELPQVANILAEIMGGSGTENLDGGEDSHEEDVHENHDSTEGQDQATGSILAEDGFQSSESSPSPDRTLTELSFPAPSTAFLVPGACPVNRKRKRQEKKRVVGILSELVQTVIESKMKSDLKMVELEEKRLKLEERRMEREAEVRREEREFQLRMLQCMMESQLGRQQESGMTSAANSQQTLPTVTCPTSDSAETEVHMHF